MLEVNFDDEADVLQVDRNRKSSACKGIRMRKTTDV